MIPIPRPGPFRLYLWVTLLIASLAKATICPTIEGVDQIFKNDNGVFIGDMHGTNESPAFLSALVCNAVIAHREVVVALEYSADSQSALDLFMNTKDRVVAERTLVATAYWNPAFQDGRRSMAMLAALGQLRKLKSAGYPIELFAYDALPTSRSTDHTTAQEERDKASANLLNSMRAKKGSKKFWVLFGGNYHARKSADAPAIQATSTAKPYIPLGYRLRDWNLTHLNASYGGGTAWNCFRLVGQTEAKCGVMILPGVAREPVKNFSVDLRNTSAFDGVYIVGPLSASPPAIQQMLN